MKRNSLCFHLCLLALICSLCVKADMLNCIRNIDGGFFDLTPLQSKDDQVVQLSDASGAKINYGFAYNTCRYATKQCKSVSLYALLYNRPTEADDKTSNSLDCIKISGVSKIDGIEYKALNPNRVADGVQLLFTGGDPITTTLKDGFSPISQTVRDANKDATYSFEMNFYCQESQETPSYGNLFFNETSFTYSINITTADACPIYSLDELSQFVDDNKILFCIIGCIVGLGIAFLGLKLFLPTLFVAGFVSGFFIALLTFFAQIITPNSRESTKWILFGFAALLGGALGYITVKVNRFGIFLIGAWLGTVISLLLYNAILYKIHTNPAELVLLITVGILGIGGGLLALKFYKYVIILSTSLAGSYLWVRSLSLVIGSFPNEILMIQQIAAQDYDFSVEWPFYVYMNAIFLLTIFSIWVQLKIKKRSDANEIEFDNDYFKKIDV